MRIWRIDQPQHGLILSDEAGKVLVVLVRR
jgi:hypothetical protein